MFTRIRQLVKNSPLRNKNPRLGCSLTTDQKFVKILRNTNIINNKGAKIQKWTKLAKTFVNLHLNLHPTKATKL